MRHKRLVLGMMIAALLATSFAADAQKISSSGAGAQAASPVVQQPGDANATILNTSTNVITGALTATRTWTLPAASTLAQGRDIRISDVTGVIATPGNNIIVAPNGTDKINGALTYAITQPYGSATLTSNGVNGWAASAQASDSPAATNFGPLSSTGTMFGPLRIMKTWQPPYTPPGGGFVYLYVGPGTTAQTCQLFIMGGSSTTPVSIKDNIGGSC